MRVPNYRAWNRDTKTMVYLDGDKEFSLFSDGIWEIAEGVCKPEYTQYASSGNSELSESIGMKDKRDEQAYTGDIVWFGKYDPETGKRVTFVIDFQRYQYCLVPYETYTDPEYCGGGFIPLTYEYPVKMEIIGNIWEKVDE